MTIAMTRRRGALLVVLGVVAGLAGGVGLTLALLDLHRDAAGQARDGAAVPAPAADEHEHEDEHGREGEDGHAPGHAEHGEHGHGHGAEGSDLDRPVDELFAAECEHGVKTHACAECRYEVGVARVPAELRSGGLVHTATVGRQRADATVALTGEVAFDETRVVHLASRVEGLIRDVHVTLGQPLAAGDPLVEVDSVALGEAESAYLESRARLALARRGAERQAALARERITSERELLAARAEARTADIELRAARERLLRLGMTPEDVQTLDSAELGSADGRVVLRAPRAGVVLKMHAVPGESVDAGEEILLLGDPSSLWVWADLYEGDLAAVEAQRAQGALPAVVRVKAFPDAEFAGTLDHLSATMDEETRTLKVRIAVANPDGRLRAGMFADVSLAVAGAGAEVLAVPKAALLEDEGRSFAFVHREGEYFVRRPVEPGREWGDWVEVAGGLQGGETIVTEGAFLLKSDVLRSKMGAGCAD